MSLEVVNMSVPQQVSTFPHGRFELFVIGRQQIGRAVYEPGWRWSEHIGPTAGTQLCEVEHLGLVISGHAAVEMTDGTEIVLGPGDFFSIPAGHDSWVVGDEDYISLHLLGAGQYAIAAGGDTSPE
jgi:quercetin dioxygenase-like cupin family protein